MNQFSYIRTGKIWLTFSGLLVLITIASLFAQGLNFSIDFLGGTRFTVQFVEERSTSEVRQAVEQAGYGGATIQQVAGQSNEFYITTQSQTEEERLAFQDQLEQSLGEYELRRVDSVSPVIGSELRRSAIWAVTLATLAMLLYIVLRFEWRFAVAAIIALTHDVVITVGFFSVFQLPVDTSFVAAILTIYGYSINDTIIIFDRIRENLKQRRKEPLIDLVDKSIRQVVVRSLNTSISTLLAITAVYLFGGETLRVLSLALIVGLAFGAYSSIFLASPIYVWLAEGKLSGRITEVQKAKTS